MNVNHFAHKSIASILIKYTPTTISGSYIDIVVKIHYWIIIIR